MPDASTAIVEHLRCGGVSVVVERRGDELPCVLHWGADLGELEERDLASFAAANRTVLGSDTLDEELRVSLLPEASRGWFGRPGLRGHRDGRSFSPRFRVTEARRARAAGSEHLVWIAEDPAAALRVRLTLELAPSGLLRLQAGLQNLGSTTFTLEALELALPVPPAADEILEHTGRHLLERQEQRSRFQPGTHLRESRRARGHDATMLLAAGVPGCSARGGEVWGVHVGWSGNTSVAAERVQPTGARVLMGGELLLAGEGALAPGDEYTSPWLWASCGDGTDALAARFHDHLRARPEHPSSPRKVLLNVWEAVYFDHSLPRLLELAERAAEVGVERFVLDDGWFEGRRDATAGLGDWRVDRAVWPDGLWPLVTRIHELGMDFGLWFEPEMVSPDSELGRAHPEWMLQPGDGRLPAPSRSQQVLNLSDDGAFPHVLAAMDALLTEYPIAYVKWDHNRDLAEAGDASTGRAAVRAQTHAAYRLLDELRARHPTVEFESCSGGGGRADLGIMSRVERLWASDTIDALERVGIEAATGLLLPPELIGSHIGAARSHTTSRTHDLAFRGAQAIFGHLGIEWDLTRITDAEARELAEWVALYKQWRPLLHSGRVVHGDPADDAIAIRGVVSHDRTEALFAVTQLRAGLSYPPGRLRIPGLDERLRYRVGLLHPADAVGPHKPGVDGWWRGETILAGSILTTAGLQLPPQHPEHTVLLSLTSHPS
ncbi:alpha-galactosidase [Pseudoclavibacter helvolus]|uniref:alpha-galactosidase n=1 Tax=Pseudoclavibacter helvolus TaxID=255205 RepID=UPI003C77FA1A